MMQVEKLDIDLAIRGGKYAEVLEEFDRKIAEREGELDGLHAGRGNALLALGRYADAAEAFAQADASHNRKLNIRHLHNLAQSRWLNSDRQGAIAAATEFAVGFSKGKIGYRLLSLMNVELIFLYYCGVTSDDEDTIATAKVYLKNAIDDQENRSGGMSGNGTLFERHVLGKATFEEALAGRCHVSSIAEISDYAARNHFHAQDAVRVLLCGASRARELGDEALCMAMLKKSTELPHTYNALEWYVARQELGCPYGAPSKT